MTLRHPFDNVPVKSAIGLGCGWSWRSDRLRAGQAEPTRHDPRAMILGLLDSVVRSLVDLLLLRQKSDAALQVEVLALRHRRRGLQRPQGRPRFQHRHRLILAALSRVLRRPAWRSFLVSPERRDRLGGVLHEYVRRAA